MLLIVPYGIETDFGSFPGIIIKLLIVPYGIETQNKCAIIFRKKRLLIVPYGIETKIAKT